MKNTLTKHYILLVFLGSSFHTAHTQNLYDHQWMFDGTFNNFVDTTLKDSAPILDFRGDTLRLYNQLLIENINDIPYDSLAECCDFDININSYCTKEGDLNIFSNYCSIREYNTFAALPGAEELSPDWHATCPSGTHGHQSNVFIPSEPEGGISHYFYGDRFFPRPQGTESYAFYDCKLSLGGTDNKLISCDTVYHDTLYQAGIGAVRHANNVDWWIVKSLKNHPDILMFHLSLSEGRIIDTLRIFNIMPQGVPGVGQLTSIKFNPQGTQMVIVDFIYGLVLYDFDRATGSLSRRRDYYLPYSRERFNPSYGVSFSSDGNQLYFSNEYYIFQLDPHSEDLLIDVDTIEYWGNYDQTRELTAFGNMQMGPDCRIYVSNISSLFSKIHVIDQPNQKGKACKLITNLTLNGYTARAYANYPNYRLGSGYSYCDSNKVLPPEWRTVPNIEKMIEESQLIVEVFPNPVSHILFLELRDRMGTEGDFVLYNAIGQLVKLKKLNRYQRNYNIDVKGLKAGLYFYNVKTDNGIGQSGKLIIE